MNKTKIIIGSLIIGLISGISSIYIATPFFAGLPFGIAVLVCLNIFIKYKSTFGEKIGFLFLSTVSCLGAVMTFLKFDDHPSSGDGWSGPNLDFSYSQNILFASFVGSLLLILFYNVIFLKIKLDLKQKVILVALGSTVGLIALIPTGEGFSWLSYVILFSVWQSVMLAAIMYTTAQSEEKQIKNTISTTIQQ